MATWRTSRGNAVAELDGLVTHIVMGILPALADLYSHLRQRRDRWVRVQ